MSIAEAVHCRRLYGRQFHSDPAVLAASSLKLAHDADKPPVSAGIPVPYDGCLVGICCGRKTR